MIESVVVALVSGGLTLMGVIISNNKRQAVTDTKVEELRFLNTYAPPVTTPETTPSAEPTPVPDPGHPDIADAIKDGTWGATPTPTAAPWFVPQTSDTFPLVGVLAVLIVAAVAIVALLVGKKRKNKQDNQ